MYPHTCCSWGQQRDRPPQDKLSSAPPHHPPGPWLLLFSPLLTFSRAQGSSIHSSFLSLLSTCAGHSTLLGAGGTGMNLPSRDPVLGTHLPFAELPQSDSDLGRVRKCSCFAHSPALLSRRCYLHAPIFLHGRCKLPVYCSKLEYLPVTTPASRARSKCQSKLEAGGTECMLCNTHSKVLRFAMGHQDI